MKKIFLSTIIPFLLSITPFQSQTIYSYYKINSKWVLNTNKKTLEYYPNKSYKKYVLTDAQMQSFITLFEKAQQTKTAHTKSKKTENAIVEIEIDTIFKVFYLKEKSDVNIKLSQKFNELLILKPKQ